MLFFDHSFYVLFVALLKICSAEVNGYYTKTWIGSSGPKSATFSVAFSGWVLPSQAVGYTGPCLQGTRYVSVGGGNGHGKFNQAGLQSIISAIKDDTFVKAGYDGICFDVEEAEGGLKTSFAAAFAAAKTKGLSVFVTTSHSAPYGAPDGATLVRSWISDTNIDFISPQLYTKGTEQEPDFTPNEQVAWDVWTKATVKIVPSIVDKSHYKKVQSWAKSQGFPLLGGYIVWASINEADPTAACMKCTATSSLVTDAWCTQTCNCHPIDQSCPANLCKCSKYNMTMSQ